MQSTHTHSPKRVVEYDSIRRRLWILGQRCHHGATGSIVAAIACVGLVVEPPSAVRPRSLMALAATTGSALMLHDWKDHSIWFERGHGNQP